MTNKKVLVGTIASSVSLKELEVFNGFLSVENGKITKKGSIQEFEELKSAGAFSDFTVTQLSADQFLMPGMVDCHTHASQFPNIGLGLDRPLLEWLPKYTYPLEMRYGDLDFAAQVYDKVVQQLLRNGTTTACYFGTIHLEGTMQLVASVIKYGQRALVGKVCMNLKNAAGYYNDTETELVQAEEFVNKVLQIKNDLVEPVVTPRGCVNCDQKLLTGLAKIASKYNCFAQSHISENLEEIDHVLSLNPNCDSFADVYEKTHFLNEKCILAHAVHLTEAEMALLSRRGTSVAHCPAANTRLRSGLCPVLKLIDHNITLGLGTDVSAGDSASILDAMRRAMDVSMYADNSGKCITWTEAFYLATLGGATALRLSDKIGSLEVGKEFDALLVDVFSPEGGVTRFPPAPTTAPSTTEHAHELLQRFIHLGDDRNIERVYVKGEIVKDLLKI